MQEDFTHLWVEEETADCGDEPEGPGEPFSATDSKLGLEPSPLNSFRMEENLLFCFILFLSFSYSSTLDCLWTGLVAVAGKGCEEEPMTGKSLDGGLVLLLPRISSISDPPRGKDFDLSRIYWIIWINNCCVMRARNGDEGYFFGPTTFLSSIR